MPPKPNATQQTQRVRSILVTPSRVISRSDDREGGEETEIAAQISVPEEGGWGWVVVIAAFFSIFILDGVSFTFGSIYKDMSNDLDMDATMINLINSIALSLYFVTGPISSALINRYGFRACSMAGAVIDSFALLCTYFTTNYTAICFIYGGVAGVGYCLINMSSALVVGFYFERLRSLALSIATAGSSVGVMIMFPFNEYITKLAGWRVLTLLHSGLFGIVFFLGMTFKPLLSLTVVTTTADDPTRTVTYLPSLATVKGAPSKIKSNVLIPTATEKIFKAVSNINFPTAADVVDERLLTATNQPGPGPSTAVSKIKLTAHSPQGLSPRQLKQVQSIMSKTSVQDSKKPNIEVTNIRPRKKQGCWARLCHWETHIPQSRPLYRDDAFFDGKLETLPIYQKSVLDTSDETKTGLEYQLAVSRAVTAVELQEHRGVFTTAARRILATMMDPALLKRFSFLLLCISGFLSYLGYIIPYVFIPDRNSEAGMSSDYCSWLVSAIALSNFFGRIVLGALGCKVNPLKLFIFSSIISGVSTMLSNLSFNVYYQYGYCFIFGFFVACLACLRSMVLVELYGLEKLTNAMGMMLLFQGVGTLISTPLASTIKATFGYAIAFHVSGICIASSGLCLLPVKYLSNKENNRLKQGEAPVPDGKNSKTSKANSRA